jgi:hypothetical protein
MDHGPGMLSVSGDFSVFEGLSNSGAVASMFNYYKKGGGWRHNETFQAALVTCEKLNIYPARVLH